MFFFNLDYSGLDFFKFFSVQPYLFLLDLLVTRLGLFFRLGNFFCFILRLPDHVGFCHLVSC